MVFYLIDDMVYTGHVNSQLQGVASAECERILNEMKTTYTETRADTSFDNNEANIKFPTISVAPTSEFHGVPIFSNAYPWLFLLKLIYVKMVENNDTLFRW